MPEIIEPYLLEYSQFMANYTKGQTSGEEVGYVIAKLAQYFCEKNQLAGITELQFHRVFANIANQIDEASGKPLSMAKAEILAKATPEAEAYGKERVHLENIEQAIGALKSLQKGILNERSLMGDT